MDAQLEPDKSMTEQTIREVYVIPDDPCKSHTFDDEVDEPSGAADFVSSKERAAAERRLLRKLDMRFMPSIVLIYIMNQIDRNAVTTARLKGIEQDLGLSDIQYDTVVAILYASYCTVQIPSNVILNQFARPSLYIGLCVMAWGLTSAMTGVTHNYAGILACRVFIGLPEAAYYPGTVFLLSRWYTRKELAFRTSILFSGMMCSNAFGSRVLMAEVVILADGGRDSFEYGREAGDQGLEMGAITVIIGVLSLWTLPDLPGNTRWITPAERRLAQARVSEDAGEADEDIAQNSMWTGLKMAITDVKVLIFSLMELSLLLGLSSVSFFPTLASTLGYSTTITLLLAAPPWIWAAIVCWLNALHADRSGERFFHTCSTWWGVIVGYIIAISTFSIGGRYFALFLMASGHAGYAVTLVWVSNTIPRPPAKRAAAIGIVNGIGSIGTLIGSYIWKAKWGPQYHQSMEICIAALVLSSFFAFVMRCMVKRMNKKLDEDELGALKDANRERVENAGRLEGITLEEAMERKKGFRYLY